MQAPIRPASRLRATCSATTWAGPWAWCSGRYVKAANAAFTDVPGGPRGYQVLATATRSEPGSQQELAHHLGVDRTVMTYLLDDLERAGLIERHPDPADRRARRIAPTERGRALLGDLDERLGAAEEQVLAGLTAADRQAFRALLLPGGVTRQRDRSRRRCVRPGRRRRRRAGAAPSLQPAAQAWASRRWAASTSSPKSLRGRRSTACAWLPPALWYSMSRSSPWTR